MPGHRSELTQLLALHGMRRDLYEQVDQHFSSAFLPMLVADGLAKKLPGILGNNPMFPEKDEDSLVIHVGSVKLALYIGAGAKSANMFSVQLFSNQDQHTAGMAYYYSRQGLGVEFTSMTPSRDPERFSILLPDTTLHPLNICLSKLYPYMVKAFQGLEADPDLLKHLAAVLRKK